ncbi:MAG: histidinol-phosphate transaminase [Bacteroidetes bacterium 41-46]|nr:MAG: histidinol-phosphate transaminase [Bacteroidetes bacterium 41-46]
MRIRDLVRENIVNLEPYNSLRDKVDKFVNILLDANESPFNNGYNRYPDSQSKKLRVAYSNLSGVPVDNLFAGNGSDEIIDLIIRVFCEPGKDGIVCLSPSFGMYKTWATINNIKCVEVTLKEDFTLCADDLFKKIDSDSKIVFLCSPNNPSGNLLDKKEIVQIIKRFNGIVVIDEAYIDFSEEMGFALDVRKFRNLIVLRTLSKAWGMAGLRVGFAMASNEIIRYLNRVKPPYNIGILSQEKAIELIKKGNSGYVRSIISERERLREGLIALPSVIKVYPSQSNFLLVKFSNHEVIHKMLLNNGVIVRDITNINGSKGYLRITVGSVSENNLLLNLLNGTLKEVSVQFVEKTRSTKETNVSVRLDPSGIMDSEIFTGISFFDHMLEQMPVHSGLSIRILVKGDIQNGPHHTIEDIAIVLGDALNELLTLSFGNRRYGFSLPMDESSSTVMLDFCNRACLTWDVQFPVPFVENIESDMFRHFFDTLSKSMKATFNIKTSGTNSHHMVESIFKAFAKSLKMMLDDSRRGQKIISSKGSL